MTDRGGNMRRKRLCIDGRIRPPEVETCAHREVGSETKSDSRFQPHRARAIEGRGQDAKEPQSLGSRRDRGLCFARVVQSIQATENVWRAIEAEFGLLSSTEVSTAVGCSTPNRSFAYDQRKAGRLIAVSRPEGLRYPGFQFDPVNRTVRRVKKDLVSAARNAGRSAASLTLWLNTPTG